MAHGNTAAGAQEFVSGALPRALSGDTNQISSIYFRAQPGYTQDPAAMAVYQAAARQLNAAGHPASQGTPWKGRSHNFFAQTARTLAPLAPLTAFIPGVGPVVAGALSAGLSLAGGRGVKDSIVSGLEAGAGNALIGGEGPAGVISRVKEGIASKGVTGGIVGKAADWVAKHPFQAAQAGLGIAGTLSAANQQGRAEQNVQRALAPVNTRFFPTSVPTPTFADPNNPYGGTVPPWLRPPMSPALSN